MNTHTALALLLLAACGSAPDASPPPPEPIEEPPPASEQAKETTVDLVRLIDRATRIEAASAKGQKPQWSKDLTPREIQQLKRGIGAGTQVSDGVPRCLPTVHVTLYDGERTLATIGSFCDDVGPMRFDMAGRTGSFVPADGKKVQAALASPVDR